eukprot:scaffold55313_cov77-Cyclotella_meneghiniana.AAC.6
MNDVMRFGLECFVSKGLHGLDFECGEGEKFRCCPNCTRLSHCLCGAFHPNHSCWTVPMSHCGYVEMMLCSLDWNALSAMVSTDWILSEERVKSSVVIPNVRG